MEKKDHLFRSNKKRIYADNPSALSQIRVNCSREWEANINGVDFHNWPLDLLTLYIEKEHHRYVKDQIPVLFTILRQIRKCSAESGRSFNKINILFTQVSVNLSAHMNIEETKVFPFIKSLAKQNTSEIYSEQARQFLDQFFQLNRDHELALNLFEKIEAYSNNYAAPTCAPDVISDAVALLKSFHEDLYFHIQIETNLLFPQALLLYEQRRNDTLIKAKAPPRN